MAVAVGAGAAAAAPLFGDCSGSLEVHRQETEPSAPIALKVALIRLDEVRTVQTQSGESKLLSVVLGDETGLVLFDAWGEQAEGYYKLLDTALGKEEDQSQDYVADLAEFSGLQEDQEHAWHRCGSCGESGFGY